MESIGKLKRTHRCGELSIKNTEQNVVLMGWVQKRRDHGGVIFLDLRDRSGVVQVVLSPDTGGLSFERSKLVRRRNMYLLCVVRCVAVHRERRIPRWLPGKWKWLQLNLKYSIQPEHSFLPRGCCR